MSLEAIRQLRRRGQKPDGVVLVLLGDRPRWLDDDASLVVIRPADEPRFMDWRPMVGLWAAVFTADNQPPARTLSVLNALEGAGAKFFGAADATGAYPMTVGAGDEHRWCLQRTREALCR